MSLDFIRGFYVLLHVVEETVLADSSLVQHVLPEFLDLSVDT